MTDDNNTPEGITPVASTLAAAGKDFGEHYGTAELAAQRGSEIGQILAQEAQERRDVLAKDPVAAEGLPSATAALAEAGHSAGKDYGTAERATGQGKQWTEMISEQNTEKAALVGATRI